MRAFDATRIIVYFSFGTARLLGVTFVDLLRDLPGDHWSLPNQNIRATVCMYGWLDVCMYGNVWNVWHGMACKHVWMCECRMHTCRFPLITRSGPKRIQKGLCFVRRGDLPRADWWFQDRKVNGDSRVNMKIDSKSEWLPSRPKSLGCQYQLMFFWGGSLFPVTATLMLSISALCASSPSSETSLLLGGEPLDTSCVDASVVKACQRSSAAAPPAPGI